MGILFMVFGILLIWASRILPELIKKSCLIGIVASRVIITRLFL